tara:strand:- start:57 stop:1034 length:978 start_codon:yes stop_codon:yes gene_type:complete
VRKFSAEEVLAVINEAVGHQYKPRITPKGDIWWSDAKAAQHPLEPATDRQDAFNRIMKKIALEDGNEFNPQYSNRGEGTEVNEIIDYAVEAGLLDRVLGSIAPRKYNKYYDSPDGPEISRGEKLRKASQTLKEHYWATDSLSGASTAGIERHHGHNRSQNQYPHLARVSTNTRVESGADNSNYRDKEGQELVDRNNTLLDQSKAKLSEDVVDEMEMDIKLQMIADSIKDPQERAGFMIDTGMATSEQLGNTTIRQYDKVGPGMTNRKFAGDNDLARAILASMREDSPGDNKERALVVDSGGGDVSIGQGVLRTNGKNGNGNGNGH